MQLAASTTCCIQCVVVCVSLNSKPVTLHETTYRYKAYLEKLPNYGSAASGTHLVSRFRYLDSPGELKIQQWLCQTNKLPQQRLNSSIMWKASS